MRRNWQIIGIIVVLLLIVGVASVALPAVQEQIFGSVPSVDVSLETENEPLAIDLEGKHPDDGFNGVPYDKGAAFLRTLEAEVGREKFDAFMRGWFDRHAFSPVTSSMFMEEVVEHLLDGDEERAEALMLQPWIYGQELPENMVAAPEGAFAEVDAAIASFNNGSTPNGEAWSGWNTAERLRFLGGIEQDLPTVRLDALDREFDLNETGNNEILFLWLKLAVANRYEPALPRLERFLTTQGRRKFVAPLITALAEDEEWGRPIAAEIYAEARPLYHPITTRGLDELGLVANLNEDKESAES